MRAPLLSIAVFVVMLWPSPAGAVTIGFDNITSATTAGMPAGYAGFTWGALGVISEAGAPGSGYDFGTVSPSYVAFGGGGGTPLSQFSSVAPFTFNSVYLTAAWWNSLNLLVAGFSGSTQLYTANLTLSLSTPLLFAPNWTGVDKITFFSSSSTAPCCLQYALDNLTVNEVVTPEPATLSLLGVGLAGAAVRRFRKRL